MPPHHVTLDPDQEMHLHPVEQGDPGLLVPAAKWPLNATVRLLLPHPQGRSRWTDPKQGTGGPGKWGEEPTQELRARPHTESPGPLPCPHQHEASLNPQNWGALLWRNRTTPVPPDQT